MLPCQFQLNIAFHNAITILLISINVSHSFEYYHIIEGNPFYFIDKSIICHAM